MAKPLLEQLWSPNHGTHRPTIDLDDRPFDNCGDMMKSAADFEKHATLTFKRYNNPKIKIDCFKLHMCTHSFTYPYHKHLLDHYLIAGAMNLGASNFQLSFSHSPFTLPRQLIQSQTLLRLSLRACTLERNYLYPANMINTTCSTLKTLVLNKVEFKGGDPMFEDVIACFSDSLEELSLSSCTGLGALSPMNLNQLYKLRRLVLSSMQIDDMFFTDNFASRFPCLKDLSIISCCRFTIIRVASTSLETIVFKIKPRDRSLWGASFEVPNIRKFSYSGSSVPWHGQLCIDGASREWNFNVSIACKGLQRTSWFLDLKRFLTEFRLSRITSLSLNVGYSFYGDDDREAEVVEVIPNPVLVERLRIDGRSSLYCALLVRLFGICRPRIVSHDWTDIVCKSLKLQQQKQKHVWCDISEQNMFGEYFGLKKVKVAANKRPWFMKKEPTYVIQKPGIIRFELMWD